MTEEIKEVVEQLSEAAADGIGVVGTVAADAVDELTVWGQKHFIEICINN